MNKLLVVVASTILLVASTAFSQSAISPILVPVSVPDATLGGYGSIWQTQLWLHNGFNEPVAGDRECSGEVPIPGQPCGHPHPPNTTELERREELVSPVGAVLIYVPLASVHQLSLSLRLFELSHHTQPIGVDVPVVREEEFFTDAVQFVGVSGSSANRVALRVYDPDVIHTGPNGGYMVRVDGLTPSGAIIASTTLQLSYAQAPREIFIPGFAALYDVTAAMPALQGVDRYDIRVTPLLPNMKYYALMSVTDLQSQQVLLIATKQ